MVCVGLSPIPVEVSWWSEDVSLERERERDRERKEVMLFLWQALIIDSSVEEVVVPSIHSMTNLLGFSPEPGTRITHAINGQFLMLEVGCVCVV